MKKILLGMLVVMALAESSAWQPLGPLSEPVDTSKSAFFVRLQLPITAWGVNGYSTNERVELNTITHYKSILGLALGVDFARRFAFDVGAGLGAREGQKISLQASGRYYFINQGRTQVFGTAVGTYHYNEDWQLPYAQGDFTKIKGWAPGVGVGFRFYFKKSFSVVSQVIANVMFADYEKKFQTGGLQQEETLLIFPTIEVAGFEWRW